MDFLDAPTTYTDTPTTHVEATSVRVRKTSQESTEVKRVLRSRNLVRETRLIPETNIVRLNVERL